MSVRVAGSTAPLFQSVDRSDRWYLQAKKGGQYEVRVRNTTGQRIAFVIAVDGINAINGVRSHLGSDEPMYVLDPWQSATIKGWRKDLGNVSKFVFVDEERSYAARTDQANGDLGWIRVAAFNEFRPVAWGKIISPYKENGDTRERVDAPHAQDAPRAESSKKSANGMGTDSVEPSAPAPASPGTGWGANQRDRVREVDFTPERFACTQVVLRYEYKDALIALGILPWRARPRSPVGARARHARFRAAADALAGTTGRNDAGAPCEAHPSSLEYAATDARRTHAKGNRTMSRVLLFAALLAVVPGLAHASASRASSSCNNRSRPPARAT